MLQESILIELNIQNISDISQLLEKANQNGQMKTVDADASSTEANPQVHGKAMEKEGQETTRLKKVKSAAAKFTKELYLVRITAPEAQAKTKKNNETLIVVQKNNRTGPRCHLCLTKKFPIVLCQSRYFEHSICYICLLAYYNVRIEDLQNGILVWSCPACDGKCCCDKCGVKEQKKSDQDSENALQSQHSCYLCLKKTSIEIPLTLHPVVQKDGRGNPVYCCRDCSDEVLSRREKYRRENKEHTTQNSEELCALCADGGISRPVNLYTCGEDKCPRAYCMKCIKVLLDDHQIVAMQYAPKWTCTNCMRLDQPKLPAAIPQMPTVKVALEAPTDVSMQLKQEETEAAPQMTHKKRRGRKKKNKLHRRVHSKVANVVPVREELPPINKDMDAVDYTAQYIKFVVDRESGVIPNGESEDSCFCCKDGGSLIECDWQRNNGDASPCPKVYHQDCLGFDIPDNAEWNCPRHHCAICGGDTTHSCRFCPVSYCSSDLPSDTVVIGAASSDLPGTLYIICNKCDAMRLEAVSRGRLLHDQGIVDIQKRDIKNGNIVQSHTVEDALFGDLNSEADADADIDAQRWTTEEQEKYEKAYKAHPNDWNAISAMVESRSPDECRNYKINEQSPWSVQERLRFTKAIREVSRVKALSVYSIAEWIHVANMVGTRSVNACQRQYTQWLQEQSLRTSIQTKGQIYLNSREDHQQRVSGTNKGGIMQERDYDRKDSAKRIRRWTDEETDTLYRMIGQFQGSPVIWNMVASAIPSRGISQCRAKYANDFARLRQKGVDEKIAQAMRKKVVWSNSADAAAISCRTRDAESKISKGNDLDLTVTGSSERYNYKRKAIESDPLKVRVTRNTKKVDDSDNAG